MVRVALDPALGLEFGAVVAEHLLALVDDPRVAADERVAGVPLALDDGALRGCHALEEAAHGGVEALGFLDHGVEVGETLALLPRQDLAGVGGDAAVGGGVVQLGHQPLVAATVLEEVVDDGGERHGRIVGPGEGDADGL